MTKMNREYAACETHATHSRSSLRHEEISGFLLKLLTLLRTLTWVPVGVPGSFIPADERPRQRFGLFGPFGECSWAHPPFSKIALRLRSPPRAHAGKVLLLYHRRLAARKRRTIASQLQSCKVAELGWNGCNVAGFEVSGLPQLGDAASRRVGDRLALCW